jgi:uncharacterized protein
LSGVCVKAFYADVRGGRRFCILHEPGTRSVRGGALVHVHAFAEEMNKSRRMVALAARVLAENGWAVLLMDLAGCGDSSGDFRDATWRGWVDDTLFAYDWLGTRFGGACWLWGSRAGCLIAAAAGVRLSGQVPLLFWQPVLAGRPHVAQFLRLKLASEALSQADERTDMQKLRSRLIKGECVEIGGYSLNPQLAEGLDRAELLLKRQQASVICLEVVSEDGIGLAPATRAHVEGLRARGVRIDAGTVIGPPFWRTVETAESPALAAATVAFLDRSDVVAV